MKPFFALFIWTTQHFHEKDAAFYHYECNETLQVTHITNKPYTNILDRQYSKILVYIFIKFIKK